MNIAIIGLGMVALSDALSLARTHHVTVTGPVPDLVDAIRAGRVPLDDPSLDAYRAAHALDLHATLDTATAIVGADCVLIGVPLSSGATEEAVTVELESRIEFVHDRCPGVPIILRSAVPVGFTDRMRQRLGSTQILYAPEFRRVGQALHDALYPDFLIVGDRGTPGERAADLLASAALTQGFPRRLMGATEAEAVKFFTHAYTAARVAYFNELDSYAMQKGLNARQVIDGVCLDPRIGSHNNNPCFGYDAGRLGRSAEALSRAFGGPHTRLMPNVAEANERRIDMLAERVLETTAGRIGIYHRGGDGPIDRLRQRLEAAGAAVQSFDGDATSLERFKSDCDLIIASRQHPDLADIAAKVFSRDHFAR